MLQRAATVVASRIKVIALLALNEPLDSNRECRVRNFRGAASADSRRVNYGAARTSISAIAAAFPSFKRIFSRMPVASTGVTKAKSTC